METRKVTEALDNVLSARYSQRDYHIGGYQEEAACLQSEDGCWIVYNAERGNRYNEIKCKTVLEASLQLIRKMTHQIEDISAMETALLQEITKGS